jgi:uncharacterized protein (TIGR02246 family)
VADTLETVDAAVRNLAGRYCAAVVDFDPSIFGDCWMRDAEWIAKGTTIQGRDRIVRVFERLRGQYSLCVQALLSGVVEVRSATEALATWQIREWQFAADGGATQLFGIYTDTCVFDGDRWRFARRDFRELFRGGFDPGGGRVVQ